MKGFWYILVVLTVLVFAAGIGLAQTDQISAGKVPIAQSLVREGDFAVRLTGALNLGSTTSEVEAESALIAAGISPRNGWIADYPVTPDIAGELRTAVVASAAAGAITLSKDRALGTFDDVMSEYNIALRADTSGAAVNEGGASSYPDEQVVSNYYSEEGPPVVTYYAPPYDYAYLYSWVPYPFWWWDFWFPGFFVLTDFDRVIDRDHDRDRHHHRGGEHFSNHFFDRRSRAVSRVDPLRRPSDRTFVASGMAGGVGSDSGVWAEATRGTKSPSVTPGNRAFIPSPSGQRTVGYNRQTMRSPVTVVPTPSGGGWYRGQANGGMQYSQPSVNRSFGSFGAGFGGGRGSFGRR